MANNRDELYTDLHLQFNFVSKKWPAEDARHGKLDGLLWELSGKLAKAARDAEIPQHALLLTTEAALLALVRDVNFQNKNLPMPSIGALSDMMRVLAVTESPEFTWRWAIGIAAGLIRRATQIPQVHR